MSIWKSLKHHEFPDTNRVVYVCNEPHDLTAMTATYNKEKQNFYSCHSKINCALQVTHWTEIPEILKT